MQHFPIDRTICIIWSMTIAITIWTKFFRTIALVDFVFDNIKALRAHFFVLIFVVLFRSVIKRKTLLALSNEDILVPFDSLSPLEIDARERREGMVDIWGDHN